MTKQLAGESEKTIRARKKLLKRHEELDKQVTKQALERKMLEIHQWIARHASNRVVLRSKTISLFDRNTNSAKVSGRIERIAMQISQRFEGE
jgi:hypothetical protein